MKTDFEMISHKFDKPISIYPIADVHYGAIEHQHAEWLAFCKRLEAEENSYIVLGGDLINNSTRNSVGNGHFDDLVRPREQKAHMVEFLRPIRHKVIGLVGGNHEARSARDTDDDPTYDIAAKLDLEDLYRPNAAFIKIGVGIHNRGVGHRDAPKQTYCVALVHGTGGGVLPGSSINRVERWGYALSGVDVVIMAHVHKMMDSHPAKLFVDPRTETVSVRPFHTVICCPWMKYGGYALQKMLLPSTTCQPQKLIFYDERRFIGMEIK